MDQKLLKDRILLGVTVILNILAFLLSMSKNSMASFAIVSTLFFAISLFDYKLRSRIMLPVIVIIALIIASVIGYQAYTGNSVLTTITDRVNDTRSLEWRYSVWGYLMGNMDTHSIFLGHGLTSSNMELYRFLFNTDKQSHEQSIFVHNAFIGFLYEMGLLGILIFSGFLAALFHSFKTYLSTKQPLRLTVVCLSIFTFICVLSDECITDLNLCLLVWFLITMIYSLFLKDSPTELTHKALNT